jgi:hypothetical protein
MYSRPIRFESKEKQVQIQLDFPELPLVWSGHQAQVLLPAYGATGLRLSLASRNSPEPKLRLAQPGSGLWHSVPTTQTFQTHHQYFCILLVGTFSFVKFTFIQILFILLCLFIYLFLYFNTE